MLEGDLFEPDLDIDFPTYQTRKQLELVNNNLESFGIKPLLYDSTLNPTEQNVKETINELNKLIEKADQERSKSLALEQEFSNKIEQINEEIVCTVFSFSNFDDIL